jgi:hypothetical protein
MNKKHLHLPLVIFMLCLFAWGMMVNGQTLQPPPAIITFTASPNAATMAEVEDGQTPLVLSWNVVNFTDVHTLTLEAQRLNAWESVIGGEDTLLAQDYRQVTLMPSLTFQPPTYRLSVRDAEGRTVDDYVLVIPFAETSDGPPEISLFTTQVQTLAVEALEQRTAMVPVSWAIIRRVPTANPVFEQVMDDGSTQVIELPRDSLWIPSAGQGVVAPFLPQSDTVRLRMQLVDMVSGEVYDEEFWDLPVGGAVVDSNPTQASGSSRIVSFAVSPDPAEPNGMATLSWEVVGASSVTIEWTDIQNNFVRLQNQPLTGQTSISLAAVKRDSPIGTLYLADHITFNAAHFDLIMIGQDGQTMRDDDGRLLRERAEISMITDLEINAVSIGPNPVAPGGTVTITWDVRNASYIGVIPLSPTGVFQESVSALVSDTGSIDLTVPAEYTGEAAYYFAARDTNGIMQYRHVATTIAGE